MFIKALNTATLAPLEGLNYLTLALFHKGAKL